MAVTHELRTPIAAIKLQLQTLCTHRPQRRINAKTLRKQALQEADRLNVLGGQGAAGEQHRRRRCWPWT